MKKLAIVIALLIGNAASANPPRTEPDSNQKPKPLCKTPGEWEQRRIRGEEDCSVVVLPRDTPPGNENRYGPYQDHDTTIFSNGEWHLGDTNTNVGQSSGNPSGSGGKSTGNSTTVSRGGES